MTTIRDQQCRFRIASPRSGRPGHGPLALADTQPLERQPSAGELNRARPAGPEPLPGPAGQPLVSALPSLLLSARVVVISDFNCPYCFTLNEWLSDLGLAGAVRWVGVEHKPHLPSGLAAVNRPDDLQTLQREVADISRRAPEVGVTLPPVWVNSRRALLIQACLEDEQPQLAHRVRRELFRAFWHHGQDLSSSAVIEAALRRSGVAAPADDQLDPQELDLITAWWTRELDRIPCLLAPTGARHLGLQDRLAVEAFVLGALRDRPDGDGCR